MSTVRTRKRSRPNPARELHAASRIPYGVHLSEEVISTRAGDYVQAFRLGGIAFESADDETINQWHERLNGLWRNIASPQVSLWTHVIRRREPIYAAETFPAGFSQNLAHRYRERLAKERLYINELYLAIVYRPPRDVFSAAALMFLSLRRHSPVSRNATNERAPAGATDSARREREDSLDACAKLREQLRSALERYEPTSLGTYQRGGVFYSSLLEYLGLLVNGESQPMPVPRAPIHHMLATSRPFFGVESLELRTPTATHLGAMLGIKEYPASTTPGLFNRLLTADFSFVLTQSFSFIPKSTAQGMLARQYQRMVNAGDLAVTQTEELRLAQDDLAGNAFVLGNHHFSLQLQTELEPGLATSDPARRLQPLNDAIAQARTLLSDIGMVVAREDLALEAAFWAQLPGNFAERPRLSPITSRNFAALAAFHNYPTGRAEGNHWGPALMTLVSASRTPRYFSLHASDPTDPEGGTHKDTGHTLICGPTGSGKTVLVGFAIARMLRFGASQVVLDKDRGLEILVRALGGEYTALKNGQGTGFNPLQLSPTPANVSFLREWLRALVTRPDRLPSVRENLELDQALRGVLALDTADRRLSRVLEFLDPTDPAGIHAQLSPWCESTHGEEAWVFDNAEDLMVSRLASNTLVGLDVTDFLDNPRTRTPVTLYLFHLVRQLLDGRRLVVWMDEFAKLLADPAFESFARDGLKTWRKRNGVVAMATQSASDALASPIARTLIEQTATQVFYPNPNATYADYVEGFGLTEREFLLIRDELNPGSRQFLLRQAHHSSVCTLDLAGMDFELDVISGRTANVEHVEQLVKAVGPDPAQWLPLFKTQRTARNAPSSAPILSPSKETVHDPH